MSSHRRVRIISAIALLVGIALLVTLANFGQWRASYTEGHAHACGALQYTPGSLLTATTDAQAAEACFADALPRCQPATLIVGIRGVDTSALDTLLIQPPFNSPFGPLGACQIVLSVVANGVASLDRTETVTCQGIALTSTSLTVYSCGTDGDMTLPATQGAPLTS